MRLAKEAQEKAGRYEIRNEQLEDKVEELEQELLLAKEQNAKLEREMEETESVAVNWRKTAEDLQDTLDIYDVAVTRVKEILNSQASRDKLNKMSELLKDLPDTEPAPGTVLPAGPVSAPPAL